MPKWNGSRPLCDFCDELHEWFVDGATEAGSWAIMCPTHFGRFGVGLGLGKGQKYDAATLEKLDGRKEE